MQRVSAVVAVLLLLAIIVIGTVITALVISPTRAEQSPSTTFVTARNTNSGSTTKLTVFLTFQNGTRYSSGSLGANQLLSRVENGSYIFSPIDPGNYSITMNNGSSLYLPPTTIKISAGSNFANLTIYSLKVFTLVEQSGLSYNGTQPGPPIEVANGTAVRIIIINNTTLIHNLAIVQNLYNLSSSQILFVSLSNTLNAGGTTNDTFVASRVGSFYYECLIGNHARAGEYGYFIVVKK